MAVNALEQDIAAVRRQRVSSLRNRGLTHEEIWQQLAAPMVNGRENPSYLENPKTKKPFDRTTITRDLEWLREDNHRQASVATEEHQARQYSELQEIKRAAWAQKDPDLALRAIEKEMKLTGTMKQPGGVNITINLEVVTRFEAVAKAAGVDASKALDEFTQMIERAHADSSTGT